MQDAAFKAARGLKRDFGEVENLQVSQKGPGDFVSAADHKAEETIISELQRARPKFSILSEETGEIEGEDGEYRFVIDPLDGTMNFLHSVPQFCISIGLEKKLPNGKTDIEAGVIYVPIYDDMYYAEKNQGAFVGNRRLLVSARQHLDSSMLGTAGLGAERNKAQETRDALMEFTRKGGNVRMLGCAALELAYVAAGKLDAFWHADLRPWDIAAGIVLVREAKGVVTDLNGDNNMMQTNEIIAANQNLYEPVKNIISATYNKS